MGTHKYPQNKWRNCVVFRSAPSCVTMALLGHASPRMSQKGSMHRLAECGGPWTVGRLRGSRWVVFTTSSRLLRGPDARCRPPHCPRSWQSKALRRTYYVCTDTRTTVMCYGCTDTNMVSMVLLICLRPTSLVREKQK